MTNAPRCPDCGAPLPLNAPEGLCPACLMKIALQTGPGAETERITIDEPATEQGQRFGPYQTMRLLGQGGMGMVYLARQDHPIQRTVALKVIKPGMDSHQVIARFESERQALAMMDHPNIAHVFDAGTAEDGRPYFVMEFVSGVPITSYCDTNQLTNRERLELFRQVCLGVHHAHQKGIIHRDLKPSNVLVTVQDGKPVPKIIDFGVAKATSQRLSEHTLFTEQGVLVGTPEYMSPEQADLSAHEVDTASDIYSLGVLLYELIAGVLPFDSRELRHAGYLEILRKIREDDPPPLTSRVKTLGATAAEVAKRRHTDVHTLQKQLRGDLEWITMRAIEKDRRRRYLSASEFAADIDRHLKDEPVLAGPPGRLYRMRKFVRKNRLSVVAAGAVIICLAVGLTTSLILYRREQRQREAADFFAYTSSLGNADALIAASKYDEARTQLFQCAPYLRGWEWRMLFAQTDNSLAALHGTGDRFRGAQMVGFTPDSRRLYLTMRKTVHVWEASTWRPIGNYGPFAGVVRGIAPDASVVLVKPDGASELQVVDVSSGNRVAGLGTFPGEGLGAFSPDGKQIAFKSSDGVRIWRSGPTSRPLVTAPECGTGLYMRPGFSPDSKLLACVGNSALVLIDAVNGRVLRRFDTKPNVPLAFSFSSDGQHLAVCDWLSSCRIWNLKAAVEPAPEIVETRIWSLAFSPDRKQIASGAWDKPVVRIWDAGTGKAVTTLATTSDEEACCRAVAYSEDGKFVASASVLGVRVWDATTLGGAILDRDVDYHRDLSLDRHARIALARQKNGVRIVDGNSGEVLSDCDAGGSVIAAALNKEGDRVAVGTQPGVVSLLDRQCAKLVELGTHTAPVAALAFDDSGTLVAASWGDLAEQMLWSGSAGLIRVWETFSGKQVASVAIPHAVRAVAFRPGHTQFATGELVNTSEASVKIWDSRSGKAVLALKTPRATQDRITDLAFTPDGKQLIAVGSGMDQFNGRIAVWDVDSGRLLHSVDDHSWGVTAVCVSPDGKLIATASYDKTIRLWDGQRFRPLYTIRRPEALAFHLAFSSDGAQLFAAYRDGTLHAWNTRVRYPIPAHETVERLARDLSLMADVRLRLASDPGLDDAMRRMALEIADIKPEAGWAHHEFIQRPLLSANAARATYERAYRRVEDEYRRLPLSTVQRFWFGTAQYRLGLHSDAKANLVAVATADPSDPAIAAVLAMVYWRTGDTQKATASLDRARVSLNAAEASGYADEGDAALVREAEALIASGKR